MPKSIFNKNNPDVKHYELLYRSLRDPLINESTASDRILAEVPSRKGKQKATDQDLAEEEQLAEPELKANEGQAAEYDIFYDDTQYDYMQHLRPVGENAGGAVLIEAPTKEKRKKDQSTTFVMPEDSLPSAPEKERNYADLLGIPQSSWGLQPDMDPKLREVLEALEDEAFATLDVEQNEDDDFFGSLVKKGERAEDEYSDEEWEEEDEEETGEWEKEIARFKAPVPVSADSDDEDFASEDGDTIADLKASSARRKPRTVVGSSFSMSSSAMFRNQGLQDLDDRFDQMEKEYATDSEESSDDERTSIHPSKQRTDMQNILDDFLSHYEVLGGKFRPSLEGASGPEKLATLRKELAVANDGEDVEAYKKRILQRAEEMLREDMKEKRVKVVDEQRDPHSKDRWDCESVLSTYSNLENHPRMIRLRDMKGSKAQKPRKIVLDPKTGFPSVAEESIGGEAEQENTAEDESDSDGSLGSQAPRQTITRSKKETAEEKKARKHAVKEERAARRVEKKTTKQTFDTERKRQKGVIDRRNPSDVASTMRAKVVPL